MNNSPEPPKVNHVNSFKNKISRFKDESRLEDDLPDIIEDNYFKREMLKISKN